MWIFLNSCSFLGGDLVIDDGTFRIGARRGSRNNFGGIVRISGKAAAWLLIPAEVERGRENPDSSAAESCDGGVVILRDVDIGGRSRGGEARNRDDAIDHAHWRLN